MKGDDERRTFRLVKIRKNGSKKERQVVYYRGHVLFRYFPDVAVKKTLERTWLATILDAVRIVAPAPSSI